jgi:hypothetical protein
MTNQSLWTILVLTWSFLVPIARVSAQTDSAEAAGLAAEQAGRLREALQFYVGAFHALPEPPPLEADRRLRERIIQVALRLNPAPAPPEEAQRRMARGQALFREARDTQDTVGVKDAAAELWQAVRYAPWWPAAAFNLAIAQETLSLYGEARQNFQLYLLASPGAEDASAVQARIYELELKMERARAAAVRAAAQSFRGTLRVGLVGGEELQVREATVDTLVRLSCRGLVPASRCAAAAETIELPPNVVTEMRRRASYSGTGTLLGGLLIGLPAGLAYGLTRPDANCSDVGVEEGKCLTDVLVMVGIIAGGTAVGTLVGGAIPKWERVYPSGR